MNLFPSSTSGARGASGWAGRRARAAASSGTPSGAASASTNSLARRQNTLPQCRGCCLLGPKLFFVTGLVILTTAVARIVCLDLLG